MEKFKRSYVIISLLGSIAIIVGFTLIAHSISVKSLTNHQFRMNSWIANELSNAIWSDIPDFVVDSYGAQNSQISTPLVQSEKLRKIVTSSTKNTNTVGMDILDLNGLVVFSTDARQVGSRSLENSVIIKVKKGGGSSSLTHFFNSDSDLQLSNRYTFTSYLPLRENGNGPTVAILKLVSNVTPVLADIYFQLVKMAIGIAFSLAFLQIVLLGLVFYANDRMKQQIAINTANHRKIQLQKFHDPLTGLPNKKYLFEELDSSFFRNHDGNKKGSILLLEFDGLQSLNSSLEIDARDRMVRGLVARISGCVRDNEKVFRLGDFTFLVLLENLDDSEIVSVIAQRIASSMNMPFSIGNHHVLAEINIGITFFSSENHNLRDLLKQAKVALVRASRLSGNQIQFYCADILAPGSDEILIETNFQSSSNDSEYLQYPEMRSKYKIRR